MNRDYCSLFICLQSNHSTLIHDEKFCARCSQHMIGCRDSRNDILNSSYHTFEYFSFLSLYKMTTEATVIISTCWVHARSVFQTYIETITSYTLIKSFISSCIEDPSRIISYYKDTDPLLTAMYYATVLTIIHYTLAEITRNYSQVGKTYSEK